MSSEEKATSTDSMGQSMSTHKSNPSPDSFGKKKAQINGKL